MITMAVMILGNVIIVTRVRSQWSGCLYYCHHQASLRWHLYYSRLSSNIWSPNSWWRGTDGRVTKSIFRYKEFISLSKHENIFQYGGQTQTRLDIFFIDVYFLCDFVSDVRTERSNYSQSCVTHCHTCRVTEASCHDKNVTHVNLWRLVRENGIRIHPALAELSDTRAPGLGPPATDQ